MPAPRKSVFVLVASDHGTMIVSRLDYATGADGNAWGVGYRLLVDGAWNQPEVEQMMHLLTRRRAHFGDGVVALDCGANIGVHTIEWAKRMTGWGRVIAIEAQERVFYALAGNIAINNCLNARALHAAVGAAEGTIRVPVPNYLLPGNLGGLELRSSARTEFIGQKIDYSEAATVAIRSMTVDGLGLTRLDLLKVDVEGMEAEVLDGARATIAACRPIIMAEHIKVGWDALANRLGPMDYKLFRTKMNLVAVHASDPTSGELRQG
jgi:FkbM family methyltransferase